MALKHLGDVDLPAHVGSGGFEHAAVYPATGHVYVSHTASHSIDVIHTPTRRHDPTIVGFTAGDVALVEHRAEPAVTWSPWKRGEATGGMFCVNDERLVDKVDVGRKPNGLSFDPGRKRLLSARVGIRKNPARPRCR